MKICGRQRRDRARDDDEDGDFLIGFAEFRFECQCNDHLMQLASVYQSGTLRFPETYNQLVNSTTTQPKADILLK